MKRIVSLALVFTLATLAVATPAVQQPAQTPSSTVELTNKDIVDMTKSGLSTEVIVAKIRSSKSKFDTSPNVLAGLKAANVADAVILAMVEGPAEAAPPPSTAFEETEVVVPDGTELEIQLHNTLSGQSAKVGDIVDFTVVRNVDVNGVTVFARDAAARARITAAKGAASWGRAGKLEWVLQDVQAIDGVRTPARFTKRHVGDSKGGTVATRAVVTTVLLGPVGLFWGFKKGKPAIIPAGNRYTVFVHGDTKIKGKRMLATK